jgi:hypothetical protein
VRDRRSLSISYYYRHSFSLEIPILHKERKKERKKGEEEEEEEEDD